MSIFSSRPKPDDILSPKVKEFSTELMKSKALMFCLSVGISSMAVDNASQKAMRLATEWTRLLDTLHLIDKISDPAIQEEEMAKVRTSMQELEKKIEEAKPGLIAAFKFDQL